MGLDGFSRLFLVHNLIVARRICKNKFRPHQHLNKFTK